MNKFDYKKSFGQNFIKDNNIIDKIVNNVDIDKDTLVIEIGPGAGSLSRKIIPRAGFSLLYEIDERLKNVLDKELGLYNNYKIIFNDFLKVNVLADVNEHSYKKIYVVANLPYYITTPIITKLLKEIYPDKIVVMVQDEVANRLSSKEGNREYGMISVLLSSKYNIRKLFKVSRNCFEPIPNVDSAVISLEKNDVLGNVDFEKFENFIKNAFKYKRKNLRNNLKMYDLSIIDDILKKYGYTLGNRAEDIPVVVYVDIVNNISV